MVSGALLVLILVGAEALKQIVAREYDSWAPALARLLVRLAGRIHPPRALEWRADAAYIQTVEGVSGLWASSSHLAAAPTLTAAALGRRLHDAVTARTFDPADLAAALAVGHQCLSRDGVADLRFRAEEAGYPYDLADTVYFLAGMLVPEPRVVSFVRSPDGAMRGFTVEGAHSEGVCLAASFYARHRRQVGRGSQRVAVIEDETLDAIGQIADLTANWFGSETPDSGCFLTLVFDATPSERFLGSQSWATETIDTCKASLAGRTLSDRAWPTSTEYGPLIRIPNLSDCP
jgi:hypothetical protein